MKLLRSKTQRVQIESQASRAHSFPVSGGWDCLEMEPRVATATYPVHGDSTRDVEALEVIAGRRSPSSPPVNQGQVAPLPRVDKHFGRERMMLDVVHAAPVRNDGDGATGIVGPLIELAEGAVGRGRDEERGVERVRRDRVDGALVVEPDLGWTDPAVAVAAALGGGGIFEVVSEDDRIVSAAEGYQWLVSL